MRIFLPIKQTVASFVYFVCAIPRWFINQFNSSLNEIKNIRYNLKNISETNIKLGIHHIEKGNIYDAIFRLRLVEKFFDPNNKIANYWLGWSYLLKGDYEKSKLALAKAQDEDKVNLLSFIENIDNQKYIPQNIYNIHRSLTSNQFSQLFDSNTQNIPENLVIELNESITYLPEEYKILDLGSNMGLLGYELKRRMQEKSHISAVEISEKMIELQKSCYEEKILYDEIFNAPVDNFIKNTNVKYDIIASLDGFTFTKDLTSTFKNIYSILNTKGYFAFAVKGREAKKHSKSIFKISYDLKEISALLHDLGLEILSFKKNNLELKNNYAIFVCRKI